MSPRFCLSALSAALLAFSAAQAAELQPLPKAEGADVAEPPTGGCKIAVPGQVRKVKLIVRDTPRAVGPYVASLPGYATREDASPDIYGPFQIDAAPGDLLRLDLVNELADGETVPQAGFANSGQPNVGGKAINLHTHGLIVDPQPYGPCGDLGDYIFDQIDWKARAHYDIAIPRTVAGGYLNAGVGAGAKEGPYPVGPYWIHSHLHGEAKPSVLAGQTAFLSIDCPPGASVKACPDAARLHGVKPADVKVLALRDLQLLMRQNQTPDKSPPAGTPAVAALSDDLAFDTSACLPGTTDLASGGGFCAARSNTYNVDAAGKFHDRTVDPSGDFAYVAWLFTVSGQMFPDITLSQDSPKQLWRIANMSAVTTYRLRLVDKAGQATPFTVASVDGVLAAEGEVGPAPTDLPPGRKTSELLLMPGARAEVVVDWSRPAANADLTLESEGFCTGFTGTANCTADPYPHVALAHVAMKAASAQREMFAKSLSIEAPPKVSRRPVALTTPPASAPANCLKMPASNYRTIRFEQDSANNFFIGPFDAAAADPAQQLQNVRSFRHDVGPGMRDHICVESGQVELWLLENDTDELHNFHIHQSRFRLATPAEMTAKRIAGDVVQDPTGLLDQAAGLTAALAAESRSAGTVWHDSIPVPPRKDDKTPGRVAIVIPFTDPHQVGTFVYHCHILEHEDGGMMGVVEVYKPGVVRTGQAAAPTGFCGKPPAGYKPPPAAPRWRQYLRTAFGY